MEKGLVGSEIRFGKNKVVVSNRYFNSNPCIYPYWVTRVSYKGIIQEVEIVNTLASRYPQMKSGMYGGRLDSPRVKHIGDYNQGKKTVEGQCGHDIFKLYDPNVQYNSKKHLVPWHGEGGLRIRGVASPSESQRNSE